MLTFPNLLPHQEADYVEVHNQVFKMTAILTDLVHPLFPIVPFWKFNVFVYRLVFAKLNKGFPFPPLVALTTDEEQGRTAAAIIINTFAQLTGYSGKHMATSR